MTATDDEVQRVAGRLKKSILAAHELERRLTEWLEIINQGGDLKVLIEKLRSVGCPEDWAARMLAPGPDRPQILQLISDTYASAVRTRMIARSRLQRRRPGDGQGAAGARGAARRLSRQETT